MRGFTLVELMITIAIMVVVLTVAIPSFLSTIQNNRITTLTNDLVGALNLARSEAIKRGVSVSVCAASDQNFTACGSDWTNGWFVFVNPDENTTFANDTTEVLLRVQQITGNDHNITSNPGISVATYNSNGFAAVGTGNVDFTLTADGCTANAGRVLSISTIGRISVAQTGC